MADLPVVPVLLLQLLDGDTIGQQWVELRPVLGATQMLTVVSPSLALEDGLMREAQGSLCLGVPLNWGQNAVKYNEAKHEPLN